VTAIETEEGRRWAESKIKALTGGDRISARFMRQDFFEFIPQFKLVIAGNHKPGLRGVDEAIRRRMNLVPFTVTIPAEERDEQLPEKLAAEWPAILNWMIQGCLEWQRNGLAQPEAVRAATEAYLDAEDSIALWLAECCESAGTFDWVSSGVLWKSWKEWAETAGENPGSQKRLTQVLRDRGFVDKRQPGTGRAGFKDLKLRAAMGV
jgi:putative DNA primase/helicase